MAKQISPLIKLRGTIDDLSFYKTEDGYLARQKGGISAERIRTDPNFLRTRLNGQEFKIGGTAGKTFRHAFSTEISKAADGRVASRLTKLMVAILQTDPTSDFGERQVQLGELDRLSKFNFNNKVLFEQVLTLPISATFNRVSGEGAVVLPARTPMADIVVPEGTTHYNFFAAAAAVDFETGLATSNRQATANLIWDSTPVAAGVLGLSLPANSTLPVFIVMGMEFMKMVNGKMYPSSKRQSPLEVVAVYLP